MNRLTRSAGRVLWEDESVRLLMTVTLDRPGTWSLNMRGVSFLRLSVPWSMDAEQVNLDEPSSGRNRFQRRLRTFIAARSSVQTMIAGRLRLRHTKCFGCWSSGNLFPSRLSNRILSRT